MTCPDCAHGLKGIDGHPSIVIDEKVSTKPQSTVYRCVSCGETYSRIYGGGGVFVWIRTSGAQPTP